MTDYLLALAIGPVQDFIAAARRTRDLWYGSNLLSELSKTAARCLKEECAAELIFPALEKDEDLKPCSDFNVVNQIIVRVRSDDIAGLAGRVQKAVCKHWQDLAAEVFKQFNSGAVSPLIDRERWNAQINDLLELYAAWVSYDDENTGEDYYQTRRQRLMELLRARKTTRAFRPGQGFAGVPKSLLDGARESVLWHGKEANVSVIRTYARRGIKFNEPLDAAGLIKRVKGGRRNYPSVAGIAANPWLRRMKEDDLEHLRNRASSIPSYVISRIDEQCYGQFAGFSFDGTLIYRDRHEAIKKDAELVDAEGQPFDQDAAEAIAALTAFGEALKPLCEPRQYGKPAPYLAVLCADGDKMGETLDRISSPKKHREFSKQLSRFATEARKIVQKHRGVCVYSGGDDVLAFVPIDHCLACADELRTAFGGCLEEFKNSSGQPPTLSVGVALGHFMEPLEALRRFGKEAEKLAKGEERNGLAVVLHPRGGAELRYRASWGRQAATDATNPGARLQIWIEAFRIGALPMNLPHDLNRLLAAYRPIATLGQKKEDFLFEAGLLRKDIERLLRAKQIIRGNDAKQRDKAPPVENSGQNAKNRWCSALLGNRLGVCEELSDFEDFAKELLLASRLTAHYPPPPEQPSDIASHQEAV